MPDLDPETFADYLPSLRRRKLHQARLEFDWKAGKGPLGGTILHLRERGRVARNSARLFLILLLITVIAGLSFYLGLPFWQTYADSRESTLQDTLRTIESEEATLDAARQVLVAGDGKDQLGLVGLLKGMPEALPSVTDSGLRGHIIIGEAIEIYGQSGTILRSDDGGLNFYTVSAGTDAHLTGSLAHGSATLFYGWDGAIIRSIDGGVKFSPVQSGTKAHLRGHIVSGNTILIYGRDGAITGPTDGGENFAAQPPVTVASLYGHIVNGETILIYGDTGTVLRSTDGGENFLPVFSGIDSFLLGSVQAKIRS